MNDLAKLGKWCLCVKVGTWNSLKFSEERVTQAPNMSNESLIPN